MLNCLLSKLRWTCLFLPSFSLAVQLKPTIAFPQVTMMIMANAQETEVQKASYWSPQVITFHHQSFCGPQFPFGLLQLLSCYMSSNIVSTAKMQTNTSSWVWAVGILKPSGTYWGNRCSQNPATQFWHIGGFDVEKCVNATCGN